ncbi:MAG: GNAT family N-acetyltransferase [Bacteroidota bacterium]
MSDALPPATWHRDGFTVTTDRTRFDVAAMQAFLATESYWKRGVPLDIVQRAADGSLCFGLFDENDGGRQIGGARCVTDTATFAYLADVYVLDAYRGRGLGQWLMRCILDHPGLQHVIRWHLTTQDAHAFYEQVGFERVPFPERFMAVLKPDPWT